MKSAILFVTSSIICHFSHGQQVFISQKVDVDSNMTAFFPSPPTEQKARGMHVYTSIVDSIYYQAIVNDSMVLKATSLRLFNITVDGLIDGFFKNKRYEHFTNITKDTTIGGTKGKLVIMQNTVKDNQPKSLYSFLTVQNYHFYGAFVSIYNENTDDLFEKIEAFFNALQFKGHNFINEAKSQTD